MQGSPVRSLLGAGPHSRRWVASQQEKLHLPPPIVPRRSHYCLTHPSPNPSSVEKFSSTKLVPGAKKIGDRWSRSLFSFFFSKKHLLDLSISLSVIRLASMRVKLNELKIKVKNIVRFRIWGGCLLSILFFFLNELMVCSSGSTRISETAVTLPEGKFQGYVIYPLIECKGQYMTDKSVLSILLLGYLFIYSFIHLFILPVPCLK